MAMVSLTEVYAIEDRLCGSMGLVNAATAELVDVIADVVARGVWEGDGIRSPEHWVAWKCAVSNRRAKRLVLLGTVLPELPACRALLAEGRLTEDHAAVICRYVLPVNDAEVADLAPGLTATQLARALRILPRRRDLQPPEPEDDPVEPVEEQPPSAGDTHGRREVRFGFEDDGMWWCRMILPPDEGALVQKALELARDDLFDPAGGPEVGWSDAVLHVAGVAIDGFTSSSGGKRRRSGERTMVILHQRDDPARPADLHLGPQLPDSLRRYLTCDSTVRWVMDRDGNPHKVARTQRAVPDWLRTLIEDRDRGCRVPGCGRRGWLHIHHIDHWEDGGRTVPENLAALCRHHHREHHLGRLHIRGDPTTVDGLTFTDRDGRDIRPLRARAPNPARARPTGRYQMPYGERLNLYWLHWN